MRFFANRHFNWLYLYTALFGLAERVGGVFVFVFLFKAGVSAALVMCAVAVTVSLRFCFRTLVTPLVRLFGLRLCHFAGMCFVALGYLILANVSGLGWALYGFIGVTAFGDALFWTCHHVTLARLGDEKTRGSQIGFMQFVLSVLGIVGPIVGGSLLLWFGPLAAFGTASLMQVAAALPLLATRKLEPQHQNQFDPAAKNFARQVYGADGFGAAMMGFGFPMAIFSTLGENFQAFGLALGFAALTGGIAALFVGRLFDLGHGIHATTIGVGALILCTLLRALGYGHPVTAVASMAMGAAAGPLYAAAYDSRVYEIAKASGNTLRFHINGEGGWDMGCCLGALISAALLWFGVNWGWILALAALGYAAVWRVLQRSYRLEFGAPKA
jgi:hypothetical protein